MQPQYNLPPAKPTEYTVYACYDDADRLLYVGVTYDPARRIREHQSSSPWYLSVVRTERSVYPTPEEAAVAEAELIRVGQPIHNALRSEKSSQLWARTRRRIVLRAKQRGNPMTGPQPDVLNARQAGIRAGVSERTIRKWIQRGHVSTHEGPHGLLIDRASLDAYRIERARRAGNGAGTGLSIVPDQGSALDLGPDVATELLAEVKALRKELAELRTALLPAPEAPPEAAPVRPDDPPVDVAPTRWARFKAWLAGG